MPTYEGESHRARAVAESFGAEAERYDRTRPHYPQGLIDRIVAACPGRTVLDVGCGTGIAARQFQRAGCRVLGVEPDTRMADFARRTGIEVEIAKFEDWEPAGRTFGAVVAGMTWHWVDPVAGAAKAAQVLRPGGRLAVFWSVMQPPPELAQAFGEVYQRALPGNPAFRSGVTALDGYSAFFAKAADGMRQVGDFSEPEQWRFDWERGYTTGQWLDQVPTSGGFRLFPAAQAQAVLDGIGDAIDAVGGHFLMKYATVAVTVER